MHVGAARSTIRFRVLGGTGPEENGFLVAIGSERQRRLLAALAMRCPGVVSTDRLVEAVWAEKRPSSPASALATVVTRLRQTLDSAEAGAGHLIVSRPPGYALDAPTEVIDANCFADLVLTGRRQRARGEVEQARHTLDEALSLWRGPAYGEFEHEDWARGEAQRLQQLWTTAREADIEICLDLGLHTEVLPDIQVLIEDEPFDDTARGLLMRALFAGGRQTEALRSLQDYRLFLAGETGLVPGPEIARLEQRILANDVTLLEPAGRPLRGYRLHERIRTTERGTLFRAVQPGLERDVAIEVIGEDIAGDPDFVRGFELQGRALAQLGHAHITPVIDCWREPEGAFLVRRLLSGGSLADSEVRERLGPEGLTRVRAQMRSALDVAHQAGLIHGPIEATDIQLDEHGTAYLSNFRLGAADATIDEDRRSFDRLFDALTGPTLEPTGAAAPARVATPYRGLAAFGENDVDVFFGRRRLVESTLTTVRDHGAAFVVGPSGCGKSSLVRAGVVPALAAGEIEGSERWFITTMVPGADPFAELEAAVLRIAVHPPAGLRNQLRDPNLGLAPTIQHVLPEPHATAVVVIDQFEELFTLTAEEDRDVFLAAVGAVMDNPDSPLRVIATVRADFYDRPLARPEIASMVTQTSIPVDALSGEELRETIVEPARLVGTEVEPELVARLLVDAAGHPGNLPLLEYTLTRLFETRRDNTLTLDAYLDIGGLTAAIGDRAEEIHAGLDPCDQQICRRLFGRLVAVDAANDIRRRALISELRAAEDEPDGFDRVAERFVEARLLLTDRDPTTREPSLEVAHEALFREWPRLSGWITSDRYTIATLRHLTTATGTWLSSGDDSELYRGARLAAALELSAEHANRLTEYERAFVATSRRAAESEQLRQRRTTNRLRTLLLLAGVLLTGALIAGLVAYDQRNNADQKAEDAEQARAQADTERLTALARSRGDVPAEVAILLALEAHRLDPSSDTLSSLHWALTAKPGYLGNIGDTRVGGDITVLGDGRRIATHSATGIQIWDVADRRLVSSLPFPGSEDAGGNVRQLRSTASDDGRVVVSAAPAVTTIHNVETEETVATLDHIGRAPVDIAISGDATRLAIGFDDGTVEIRNLAAPARVAASFAVDVIEPAVMSLAWHPSRPQLAIATAEGVALWETAQGDVVRASGRAPNAGTNFAERLRPRLLYSPDGDRLIVSGVVADAVTADSAQAVPNAIREIDTRSGNDTGIAVEVAGQGHSSISWLDSDATMVVAAGQGKVEVIDLREGAIDQRPVEVSQEASAFLPRLGIVAREAGIGLDLHSIDGSDQMVRRPSLPPGAADRYERGGSVLIGVDPTGERALAAGAVAADVSPPHIIDLGPGGVWQPFENADGATPPFAWGSGTGMTTLEAAADGIQWRRLGWDGVALGPPSDPTEIPDLIVQSASGERQMLRINGVEVLFDSTGAFREVARLEPLDAPYACCVLPAFSPDDAFYSRPDRRGGTELYDATTGDRIPFDHDAEVLLFGPRGEWFLTADEFGALQLHDQTTGQPIGPPMVSQRGRDGTIVPTIDGDRFASFDGNGESRVWDVANATRIGRTIDSIARGSGGGWSADGGWFWVLSDDGGVHIEVWNFDTDTWPEIACELAGRNMTPDEWADFGPRTIERGATCPQYPL
ncbi:MAG: winged helix-turn-helix domain-containing protein [Acidimicrobiia bacterium]|nr:winged helix-turn-helix domain-containing protein [Acidimicrobiia bacterium]